MSEQKIPLSGPIVTWDQLLSPLQHNGTEHSRKVLSPAKKRLQISVIQTLVLCIWHGKHSYSYDLCWPSNRSNDYWNLPQARQDFTSLVLISSIITATVWSNYYYTLFWPRDSNCELWLQKWKRRGRARLQAQASVPEARISATTHTSC